jgi:hypothetical protein
MSGLGNTSDSTPKKLSNSSNKKPFNKFRLHQTEIPPLTRRPIIISSGVYLERLYFKGAPIKIVTKQPCAIKIKSHLKGLFKQEYIL